jgi:hypothetical protein
MSMVSAVVKEGVWEEEVDEGDLGDELCAEDEDGEEVGRICNGCLAVHL